MVYDDRQLGSSINRVVIGAAMNEVTSDGRSSCTNRDKIEEVTARQQEEDNEGANVWLVPYGY